MSTEEPDVVVHLQHGLCGQVIVEVEHAGAHQACTQVLVCCVQCGQRSGDRAQHHILSVQEPDNSEMLLHQLAYDFFNGI